MITKQDLQEAIAECEGQRKPTASTCLKLAAFYVLKDKMYPEVKPMYQESPRSYAYMDSGENKTENVIDYDSGSDFSKRINGRKVEDILPIMDDLMDALTAINPRLYESVMRKI